MKNKILIRKDKKAFLSWPIILILLLIMLVMVGYYIKPLLEMFNDTKSKYVEDISTEEGMYKVIKSYASEQEKYTQAIQLATEFMSTEKYSKSKYMPEVFYYLFYSQVQSFDYAGAKGTMNKYITLYYRGTVSDQLFIKSPKDKGKGIPVSTALFQMAVKPNTISSYEPLFERTDGALAKIDFQFIKDDLYMRWPGFDGVKIKYAAYLNPFYIGWYLYLTSNNNCNPENLALFKKMFDMPEGMVGPSQYDSRALDEVRKICVKS